MVAVPLVIHRAATGDFMPFAGLVLSSGGRQKPHRGRNGALTDLLTGPAVVHAGGGYGRDSGHVPAGDDRARFLRRACAIWPHEVPDCASADASGVAL